MDVADAPTELVLPQGAKGSEAVKALNVISTAHAQGGESARRTIQVQTDALEKAYQANNDLVKQVVGMAEYVTNCAKTTSEIAKIQAQRDIELAKVSADGQFEERLIKMAEGPIGQALLAHVGVKPTIPPEIQQAVKRVITRLYAHEDFCAVLQAENPEDWAQWLKFVDVL